MPRKITQNCIACGSCQATCPIDCITDGDIYVIDANSCIDCGACESACPVEAIIEE